MLIGNLGADPEVRYSASGQPIAHFRVATSHYRCDPNGERQKVTEWHRVVAFDKLAELASEYLHKGRQVYVEGRLQTRQWTDQQGQNRYMTEIIANDITLLGGGQGDAAGDAREEPPAAPQRRLQRQPTRDETFGEDLDDVPFSLS
jgi:single-strand DNA-binding protein